VQKGQASPSTPPGFGVCLHNETNELKKRMCKRDLIAPTDLQVGGHLDQVVQSVWTWV
jgi:hypothetical protein